MYLQMVQLASNLTKALNAFLIKFDAQQQSQGGRNMLAAMEGDPHQYLYKILLQCKRKHCNYNLLGYSTLSKLCLFISYLIFDSN